jgi:murein L,D-transpeptidase YafK
VRRATAVLAAAVLLACAGPPKPPPSMPGTAAHLPMPASNRCPRIERLEVRKSERALIVSCSGGARLRFSVALSREPVGAKLRRGDDRVPEGDYRIIGPARPSRFHRFLPIDYPASADAARGLAAGVISRADYQAIVQAHRVGRPPPQDTALGGHLGFHGEGERWRGDLGLDWTDGCIAVADETIDLLAARAPPGTPVRIVP